MPIIALHVKILRVEGLQLKSISSSLPRLNQLEELYAADNELSSVEDIHGRYPVLEVLDVRRNTIQSVDDLGSLVKLGTLSELQLEANPLCSTSEK